MKKNTKTIFLFLMISIFDFSLLASQEYKNLKNVYSVSGETLQALIPSESSRAKLEIARMNYLKNPSDSDAMIWLGRRIAYTGDYHGAIDVFSQGIRKFPEDARFYRHRGHRYISIRQFDNAISDLEFASQLMKSQPNQIEPDGLPNKKNIPLTTTYGNIWYHLGLAH